MVQERSPAEVQTEAKMEETRQFVRQVRKVSRRKFAPDEKVRIVLEGFRGEVRVSNLCRRQVIRGRAEGPGGIRTHDSRIKSPGLFR